MSCPPQKRNLEGTGIVDIDTKDKQILYEKGIQLVEQGNHREALQYFDEALLIDPTDTVIWGRRGVTLYHLKRYEMAISSFDRALATNPNDIILWRLKGFAMEKIGKKIGAECCYDKIKKIQIEEIAKEHSTKTSNIFTCVRCGKIFVRGSTGSRLCPDCYKTVKNGNELPHPIWTLNYQSGDVIDTDHYE